MKVTAKYLNGKVENFDLDLTKHIHKMLLESALKAAVAGEAVVTIGEEQTASAPEPEDEAEEGYTGPTAEDYEAWAQDRADELARFRDNY